MIGSRFVSAFVLFLCFVIWSGCSPTNSDPSANTPAFSLPETNSSKQPAVDSGIAIPVPPTPTGNRNQIGRFSFLIPDHFQSVEFPPGSVSPGWQMSGWRSPGTGDLPRATLVIGLSPASEEIETEAHNESKFLINQIRGNADTLGIKVQKRTEIETTQIGGIKFLSMEWQGQVADQSPVSGKLTSAVDRQQLLTIMHQVYQGDADTQFKEMSEYLRQTKVNGAE